MSYYPTNFYSNYPYGQQYPNGPMLSSQQQIMQQQNLINQVGTLQGKMVDGEDIVKVTDVPIGGYGIFPKADFSEVYIKSWNNNGTTSIITYKPVITEEKTPEENINNILLERMNKLEEKIDTIILSKDKGNDIVKDEQKITNNNSIKRKEF